MRDRQRKHAELVSAELEWHDGCAIDDVSPGSGLAVTVEGEQIAIVRTRDGLLAAVSNFDPFSQAFVIARGSVEARAGVPIITSPIYQQSFELENGECLDAPNVRLAVFPIRVAGGRIQIARLVRPKSADE